MNIDDYIPFSLYLPKTKEKFFVSNIYELKDLFNNLIDLKHTFIEFKYGNIRLIDINKKATSYLSLRLYHSSFTDILTYNKKTIGFDLLLFLLDSEMLDYKIAVSIERFISNSKAINPIDLKFEELGSRLAKAKMGESTPNNTDSKIHDILLDNRLSDREKSVKLCSV